MRPIRSTYVAACAVVGLLALGSPSKAQNPYNITFSFTGNAGTNIAGSLLATSTNGTDFLATSGSATINAGGTGGFQTGTFSLLAPNAYEGNDNLLPLDGNGLSFGNASYQFVLYNDNPLYIAGDNGTGGDFGTFTFNATPAAVPELSTMLGFGSFVALGGLAAFRQRKSVYKAA